MINPYVYIGQTRSRSLIKRLTEFGFGEMCVRGEFPPKRMPYAFDNGAYKDWRTGTVFAAREFMQEVEKIQSSGTRPDFVVVPDIVAGGLESLKFSSCWVGRLIGTGPLYLAVQDGMNSDNVVAAVQTHPYAGLFVGGTLKWKVRTGKVWVDLAHSMGLLCHIGRVGTRDRTRWARRIGADSIDSALPLWSEENLQRFLSGLKDDPHPRMFP